MDEDTSRVYSPSRLDTYKNCPRQYKFRYIDRIKREGKTVEAHLGTSVHKALELLYAGLQHGKRMTEAELSAAYEDAWGRGLVQPMKFHDSRYTLEDWQRVGRDCLVSYYRAHQPFDEDKTVSVEARIGFPLELHKSDEGAAPTVRIEGYMDRLALAPDGAFVIHDYKTGAALPTQAHQDADWQLAIYNVAVLSSWPDTKAVRLAWHYLRHGKDILSSRTPGQLEGLKEDLRSLIETIRRDREFEPVKSPLCDWCEYRDVCPLWKHAEAYALLPEEERKHEAGVKLVDAFAALEHKRRLLGDEIAGVESEEEDLKKRLVEYADRRELLSVVGTDAVVDIRVKEEFHFPTKTHAPEKLDHIEAKLKATGIWPEISRLDPRALMDGFKKKRWPREVLELVAGWIDKLIVHETVKTARLRRKKEAEEE